MDEIQGAFWGDCTHPHKVVVPEKRGPHVATQICRDRKKFFSWIPKPESVARQHENTAILTSLSKLPNLPPWERQFVRDLTSHKHISPRQQAKLLELQDRFLGKENANDGFHGETLSPNRNPSHNV